MASTINPDPDPNTKPAFVPLEANPPLMTELIHRLGVSKQLQLHDVLDPKDPELLAFIPRPALAVLLVFPINAPYESHRIAEDSALPEYAGKGDKEPVMWFRQTIRNACGLMGLLHAVSNGPARDFIEKDTTLDKLLGKAVDMDPSERARLLEQTPELATAHAHAASGGDTAAPDAQDDVDLHYVCFVKGKDGRLWQLDGRRKGPVPVAELQSDEDVLSPDALKLGPLAFIERGGEDLRFSAVALAQSWD